MRISRTHPDGRASRCQSIGCSIRRGSRACDFGCTTPGAARKQHDVEGDMAAPQGAWKGTAGRACWSAGRAGDVVDADTATITTTAIVARRARAACPARPVYQFHRPRMSPLPRVVLPWHAQPVICVIIPTFGQVIYTTRCLASIARHPPGVAFQGARRRGCVGRSANQAPTGYTESGH